VIHCFGRGDVDFALRQKTREGWAVNRERFEVFLEHDPDGCFVAMADDQLVGMITTVCFGPSGWIGNLIVDPRSRGRGIGRALMEHGLDRLLARGTATVRLEGDPPGVPLYRKLGFVDEFDSCRFARSASAMRPTLDDSSIDVMSFGDLDEVAELDATIFGANRRRFLELILSCADLALVRRRGGSIVASLLASHTDRGLRIGPCVAVSRNDAQCLIAAAIAAADGRPVLIGVPAPNTEGIGMLTDMEFENRPPTLRMRLGPPIAAGDPCGVFAVSSGAAG
jgi:GNAT superfamily N-acetyltransferase